MRSKRARQLQGEHTGMRLAALDGASPLLRSLCVALLSLASFRFFFPWRSQPLPLPPPISKPRPPPPPAPWPPRPSPSTSPLPEIGIPSSARLGTSSRTTSCFCFDLCTPEAASSFVHQTRGVVIRSRGSRWLSYLSAVYSGRARLPFELWRLNLFYENTHAWRRLWPAAASPFRDCSMRGAHQHECNDKMCKAWRAELNGVTGRSHDGRKGGNGTDWLALYHAERARQGRRRIHGDGVDTLEWGADSIGEQLRSVQVFTRRSEALGRRLYRSNQWVEVVRSDHRPLGFQEGMQPPNCSKATGLFRRARSPGGLASLFWAAEKKPKLPSCDWSQYPPGCFMRPAVGSGVWVNTGRTRAAAALRLVAGIRNPVAIEVLNAVHDGVDTLQYAWGDAVDQGRNQQTWPPLLVSTSPECVGRQQGVRACLPNEMRGGWHDSACRCDDMLGVINCAGRAPPSLKPRSRRRSRLTLNAKMTPGRPVGRGSYSS